MTYIRIRTSNNIRTYTYVHVHITCNVFYTTRALLVSRRLCFFDRYLRISGCRAPTRDPAATVRAVKCQEKTRHVHLSVVVAAQNSNPRPPPEFRFGPAFIAHRTLGGTTARMIFCVFVKNFFSQYISVVPRAKIVCTGLMTNHLFRLK